MLYIFCEGECTNNKLAGLVLFLIVHDITCFDRIDATRTPRGFFFATMRTLNAKYVILK